MIGQSVPRIDALDKVTGRAKYTADILQEFPGILHIKALRSPYAHARIVRLDTKKAERLPGVRLILTAADMPDEDWWKWPPQSRLATQETLWAGQAVALVAATTAELAQDAVEAIEVEYQQLPHVLDWQSAISDHPAAIVDPSMKNRPRDPRCTHLCDNVGGEYHLRKGNADQAMAGADVIAEGNFWSKKKSHNQLERAITIAQYQPEQGTLTLYGNGGGVHKVIKTNVCRLLNLPRSKVRIIQLYTGGSFGNRNTPYIDVVAALMAVKTKATVVFEFTREEMMIASPSSWVCGIWMRMGATKDGVLVGQEMDLVEEVGTDCHFDNYNGVRSSSHAASLYKIPNAKWDTCSVLTNTVPVGPYRGPGTPEVTYAQEILINRLAESIGMDPLSFRLKNLLQRGDENAYGEKITSIGVAECLKRVAESIELDQPCVQDDSVWVKGKGIACACKQSSPIGRAEAIVLYHEDGFVELRVSCDEHGMGLSTALTQIAATELHLPMDKIHTKVSDTDITPYDHYTATCRGTYTAGNAVRLACMDAKRQLQEAAAREVGVHPDMVEIKGDRAYIRSSYIEELDLRTLFKVQNRFVSNNYGLQSGTPVCGHGSYSSGPAVPFDENGRTPKAFNWYQYTATAVEIAVNTETGKIKILRFANAADTGNPINPKLVEGQLEGGAHMAIGFMLQEEHLYDKNGRLTNANLADYRLPTILDMPHTKDVHVYICPDPLPDGPYGAKGTAETVSAALGPAIATALHQAVGIWIDDYPLTAEKVLWALRAREAKK